MEKAYMMVTCPVMDGVNGGHHSIHSHVDSPVPLKQLPFQQRSKQGAHEEIICSLGTPGSLLDSVDNAFNEDPLNRDMWPDVVVHRQYLQSKKLVTIGEIPDSRLLRLRDEEL
jgi:hypothetical protein